MNINIPDTYIVFVLICLGIIFWYFIYGIELFINGAFMNKSHLYYMFEELMWILPGGWKRRIQYCQGDIEAAKSLPGIFHFIIMHILIPFAMPILYLMKFY